MNELLTITDQEKEALKIIKEKMLLIEMYSLEWFRLKGEYQKLYKKIEKREVMK